MSSTVTATVISIFLPVFAHAQQDSCYAFSENPYFGFSTKTAYQVAYNKDGIFPPPDCKPLQLWLVSRHGTRWPLAEEYSKLASLYDMKKSIISNYNNNKTLLCMEDMENLKNWQFNATLDQAELLTAQGRDDMYLLGTRVRNFFPQLLMTDYSAEKFILRYTDMPRTKESAEYFARGVFGIGFNDTPPSMPDAIYDDPLLRPYENCPMRDNNSDSNHYEQRKFEESEYISDVIHSVSQRLGFDHNLSLANIKTIYNGCRYQKAWEVSKVSPWCAAFSNEDLVVLEYHEDVSYYYTTGPGDPMNLHLACRLSKDLIERFSKIETQPVGNHPVGIFYFSHDTMVDMLSARLELNEQFLPLTADNCPEQQHRQFRTSHICPFAGNILAVLYNCSQAGSLKMMFYQSEYIVEYPGCDSGLCEWSYIKHKFSSFTQNSSCTDNSFCFSSGSSSYMTGTWPDLLTTLIISLISYLLLLC